MAFYNPVLWTKLCPEVSWPCTLGIPTLMDLWALWGFPFLGGRDTYIRSVLPLPLGSSLSDLPRKMVIIHLKNQTQTHHSLPKQLLITKLKSHVSGSSCFCQERSVRWEGLPSHRSETENSMSWHFPSCRWKLSVFRPQQLGYGKVGSLFQGAQLLCDLSLSSLAISVSALLIIPSCRRN